MKDSSSTYPGAGLLLKRLAEAAFFATLILIPLRLRIDLIPRPDLPVYGDYTDFLLFAPDIALLAMLILWGASLLMLRGRIQLGPAFIWVPLAGVTLAGLVSIATSVDRMLSLYHVIRLAALFGFFLYVVNNVVKPASVVVAVAIQGIVQSLVAIAQFLSQHSVGLQVLGEYLLDPAWNGVSIVSSGAERVLRAYGLSDHPNILGGCLAFGLIVLLAVYLWGEWDRRVMVLAAFLPMSLALLLTFSRAAWVAFFVGAAFLIGIEIAFRRRTALKPLLWLILAAGILLAPFVWQERTLLGIRLGAHAAFATVAAEEQSVGERVLLMQVANQIFAGHALTGIGLGAAPIAIKDEYPAISTDYQPPHLALLEAALETGILGGTFYFLLLILPWVVLFRRREMLAQPQVAGAAALLLAVSVVGFFDYYTWLLVPGRLWQWLSWGLAAVALRKAS